MIERVDNPGDNGVSQPASEITTDQPAQHLLERGAVPDASTIRFRVDPADVPAEKAARRLHLTPQQFGEVLPRLLARGFPPADPDTLMYDLDEIDRWRAARHRVDVPVPVSLTARDANLQAQPAPAGGAAERFIAAKDRQATERRRAVA
jgi:hypothetical protein